jgi:hypothetical protein
LSSSFTFRSLLGGATVCATVALVGACAQMATNAFGGDDATGAGGDAANGTSSGFGDSDGGAAEPKAEVFRGNPLCHVPTNADAGCMPDDPLACTKDAGASYDAGPATPLEACRVEKREAGAGPPIAPKCDDGFSATGVDGAKCASGADCAAGFDCVDTVGGSSCRRYCCLGTCGSSSASGSATFCDIQHLVDLAGSPNQTVAPVCMPLKPCKLLVPGQCATNETCAVVNEAGDTGCVPVESAQVNAPCDQIHCAPDLTCLGQPGNRKCERLCKVGGDPACPSPQTCMTTSAFKDPSYGICQ